MIVLLILIPLALILMVGWVIAFLWAVDKNQFDDPQGNAERILLPDHVPPKIKRKAH